MNGNLIFAMKLIDERCFIPIEVYIEHIINCKLVRCRLFQISVVYYLFHEVFDISCQNSTISEKWFFFFFDWFAFRLIFLRNLIILPWTWAISDRKMMRSVSSNLSAVIKIINEPRLILLWSFVWMTLRWEQIKTATSTKTKTKAKAKAKAKQNKSRCLLLRKTCSEYHLIFLFATEACFLSRWQSRSTNTIIIIR